MSTVAQVAGTHPLYAGTDEPIGVDAAGTRWSIVFQGRNAILTAGFAAGVSLEFKIPTSGSGTKNGSVAAFTIPNFGNAQWVTYREHVKFEVRFPAGPPKLNLIQVNVARLSADLVSDGAGGLDVVSGGVKVGAMPRPWIDYTPDGSTDRTRVWLDWVVADPTMTLALPTLTATEWQTAVLDPTVVTTATTGTATAYPNQRKLDRTSNGVLWGMYWDGTSGTGTPMHFRYSIDDGATWADGGGFGFLSVGTARIPNGSFFVASDSTTGDEIAVVAYKDRDSGYIYFRLGTFDATRTTLTWSTQSSIATATAHDFPDVVAHRTGTGWTAHVVWAAGNNALYKPVTISSGGTVTVGAQVLLGGSYGGTDTYPSIDFNHTGDGKTVAGSTPHLYVAWSAGATGAGKGIRFKKATYSGGSWTWGTEREIDSTRYIANSAYWVNCLFDGTRVVIAGNVYDGANQDLILHERDAADTTTTSRALIDNAASAAWAQAGSTSYDSDGNVYVIGRYYDGSNRVGYRKWTRATAILSTMVTVDSTGNDFPYVSAKRGYSGGKIEFIYTDGTASPYSVTYDAITVAVPEQHESAGAATSVTATAVGGGNVTETGSNGAAIAVTVRSTGAGTATESPRAGATASVTVTTAGAGTGTEAANNGAPTTVTVTATGAGNAATENASGATTTVTVGATGGGVAREHASGGTGTTVVVRATGGTVTPQDESGGASATVTIVAYTGSAATETASTGATATIAVHTTGAGYNPDGMRDITLTVGSPTGHPLTIGTATKATAFTVGSPIPHTFTVATPRS